MIFKLDPDRPPRMSREALRRLDRLSDDELTEAARADPDNPPLSDDQLADMVRPVDVRALRERLGLTQRAFAERFRLPLGTVQDWERRRVQPDIAARLLLTVIEREPEAVERALRPQTAGRADHPK